MSRIKDAFIGDMLYEPRALARSSDPATSYAAAEKVKPKISHLEKMVYEAIVSAGPHGSTWNEISQRTGIDKASISPRFKPLRKKGLIEAKIAFYDTPRVDTRNGQTIWLATSTRGM